MLLQFLKQIGVGQVLGRSNSKREENLKRWTEERDRKTIRERGRKQHRHEDYHPNGNNLDEHHNHNDWTY
jgi:hypothetical protein